MEWLVWQIRAGGVIHVQPKRRRRDFRISIDFLEASVMC